MKNDLSQAKRLIKECLDVQNPYLDLDMKENPIKNPPLEVLRQGRQSVLDWFKVKKD